MNDELAARGAVRMDELYVPRVGSNWNIAEARKAQKEGGRPAIASQPLKKIHVRVIHPINNHDRAQDQAHLL